MTKKPTNWLLVTTIIFGVIVLLLVVVFVVIPALRSDSVNNTPPIQNETSVICDKDFYNCANFTTRAEAQVVYDACFSISGDIHGLDNNGDGEVCESLS